MKHLLVACILLLALPAECRAYNPQSSPVSTRMPAQPNMRSTISPLQACSKLDLMTDIKLKIADCQSALKLFEQGSKLSLIPGKNTLAPDNSDASVRRDVAAAYVTLGFAYMRQDFGLACAPENSGKAQALESWSTAFAIDPEFVDPLLAQAEYHIANCQRQQALVLLQRAEKLAPNESRVFAALANLHRTDNQRKAALVFAAKAVQLAPDSYEAQLALGRVLLVSRRLPEAAKALTAAAQLFRGQQDLPRSNIIPEHALMLLASTYRAMGDPALAAQSYERYMQLADGALKNFSAYASLAQFHEDAGRVNDAVADLGNAIRLAPPGIAEQMRLKQVLLKASLQQEGRNTSELASLLREGDLKTKLRVQVFLRNQGYDYVEINGREDDATQRALAECMSDEKCRAIAGEAI